MSNPSQSLACRLDWREVFRVIGLDYPNRSDLPQTMPCPLCHLGVLTVMQDHVLHAEWFHCRGCKFAGDLIEFAACVRKSAISETLDYLEVHKMFRGRLSDDDVTKYQTDHVDYRQRIKAFWEAANLAPTQLAKMGTSGFRIFRKLSLGDDAYRDTWTDHGGKLFGVARHQTIEDLFAPLSFEPQERQNRNGKSTRRRGGGPGKRRVFEGHDWDEVLVIPHSDLPSRIIGFTFIGRDSDNHEVVYKRANIGCCAVRTRESGIGFLEAINGAPHPTFGRFVFVFLDEQIATLLHSRHLRDSTRPLPIVLAKSTRDFDLLNLAPDLGESKLVLCGPPLKTLPLAKAHNTLVSEYQISDAEVRDNLKHRSSRAFLDLYRKRAFPWISVFHRLLATRKRDELDVLIGQMKLTPHESVELQQGLGGESSDRFAKLDPNRVGVRSVEFGSYVVEESADGWIAKKAGKEESICNLPIRIDTTFRTGAGDILYGISAQCENESFRMVISDRDLKRGTLFDLVAIAFKNEFNRHFHFVRRKWAKESFAIAMLFSNPELIVYADRVGWSQERHRFQFPQFAIHSNGNVDLAPIPIRQSRRSVPASELAAPSSCREALELLSQRSPETRIIWALAGCIAHNLLSGNCVREPIGVILDGRFAHDTGVKVAIALGCSLIDVTRRGKASILDFVSAECGAHDYLSLIRFGDKSRPQISTAWLDDPNLRKAIIPLPSCPAIAVSAHSGFVRIRSTEFPQPVGRLISAAQWIVPNYLQDVCRRKKLIDIWARENELLCVLKDMSEWIGRIGGKSKAVLDAENLLHFDSRRPALAFVELTEEMRRAGDIGGIDAQSDVDAAKAPIATIKQRISADQPQCIQVRHWVINEVLSGIRAPAIRPDDVQADLESCSALLGVIQEECGTSWMVDAEWWQSTSALVGKKQSPDYSANSAKMPVNGPRANDLFEVQKLACE